MKILITGMSGVGKSTLCEHLLKLGYKSFDLDDIPGLCNLYHPDGTVVSAEENRVELDMLETDYLCDTDKLYQHIDGQTGNVFYLGFVDNFSEVAKYFDKILLLTTTPEENKRRLSVRTTTDFAKAEKTQNELMQFKEEWEGLVINSGARVIDASKETRAIASDILGLLDL